MTDFWISRQKVAHLFLGVSEVIGVPPNPDGWFIIVLTTLDPT